MLTALSTLPGSSLLVDIGNTRIKWACHGSDGLTSPGALPHTDTPWQSDLRQVWSPLPRPATLAIASVVPALTSQLEHLARQLWPDVAIYRAVAETECRGVRNSYAEPERLGVDRWLALLAARQLTSRPVCIVDCGSAVTIDVMDDDGQHLGGVIMPGLNMMRRVLHQHTAQLPLTAAAPALGLGSCTAAAIDNGTLYALVGAIERVLASQAPTLQLLLTGGDAVRVAPYLSSPLQIHPDLVLQGLALWLTTPGSKHSSWRSPC